MVKLFPSFVSNREKTIDIIESQFKIHAFLFQYKKSSVDYRVRGLVGISCFCVSLLTFVWIFSRVFPSVRYLCAVFKPSACRLFNLQYRRIFIFNDKKFDIIILKEGTAVFTSYLMRVFCSKNIVQTLNSKPRFYFSTLLKNERLC